MVMSVEERLAQRNESFDERVERVQQQQPFAHGVDRVLMDDKLKSFVAQDLDEDAKYRLANSLYVSNTYKIPFEQAHQNYDGVISEMFKGKTISPKQVYEKIQWMSMTEKQRFDNYHSNTGAWDEFKDFFASRWQRGKAMFAGLIEMDTDASLGIRRTIGVPDEFGYTKKINEWSVAMRDGVKQYMEENPGQFLNVPGDGFWDTTWNYIKHPEVIAAGVAEQVPLILASTLSSGTAGVVAKAVGATAKATKTAQFIAGVQGFAVPLTGEKYSGLRMDGVDPSTAIPLAILQGQSEGFLEHWTLTFNMRLFHGAGGTAKKGISEMAAKWLMNKPKAVQAGAFVAGVYGQGVTEEGLQGLSDNFWTMVFLDPDQDLMEGVLQQGAAGGLLELVMGSTYRGVGALTGRKFVSTSEQLAKIEFLRDNFVNNPDVGLNLKQKEEWNGELDHRRQNVIDGNWQAAPESSVVAEPPAEGITAGVEATTPQGAVQPQPQGGAKPLAEPPTPEKNPVRFGIQETPDGWLVKDWETQKELTKPMKHRQAVQALNEYNQGIRTVKQDRQTPLQPWDAVTMSTREIFNAVMAGESKAARQAYVEGAKDVLDIHKDLGRYAHLALKGLDITQRQRQSLISALTQAKNKSEAAIALANIHKIKYDATKTKAISKLKELISIVNRRTGKTMQEKGIRAEYLEKIQAVTDGLIFKKPTEGQKKRIESLKEYLKNIKEKELSQYEEAYIESLIPKQLLDKVDKIGLKPVQDLGLEEINEIRDTVERLVNLNDLKNRLIMGQIGENVASQLNQAMEEASQLKNRRVIKDRPLSSRDDPRKQNPFRKIADWFAGNKNFDIETLSEVISAGNHGAVWDILSNGFSDGREAQYRYLDEWDDIQQKAFDDAGITLEDLQELSRGFYRLFKVGAVRDILESKGIVKEVETHTIKIGGKDVEMTKAELLSFYKHIQSIDNLQEIMKANVAFATHKIGEFSPEGVFVSEMITMSEIESIAAFVESDKKLMALAKMADDLHGFSKENINQKTRKLYGVDKATDEQYWHRDRYTGGGIAGMQAFRNSLNENEGRLQERTGSGNPVIIRDFFEVLFADQQAIAEFIGLAEPLRVMKNLMNYKPFRDTVREKGYQEELKMTDVMIERTEQKPHYYSSFDTGVGIVTRGLTRAVLANPGIMAGQYSSVLGYFTEVSPKYMKALKVLPDKAFQDTLKQHWHTYRRRAEGGVSSVALSDATQSDVLLKTYARQEGFLNKILKGIHAVDILAITDGARIVRAEMADKNLSGKSLEYWMNRDIDPSTLESDSQQYWDEFVKRANYLIRRTQPMFETENRSMHTSDPGQGGRMFFLFRSYIDQPIRIAARAVNEHQYGKISDRTLAQQLGTIWAGFTMYEVTRFAIDKMVFSSDDDEKDLFLNILTSPIRPIAILGWSISNIVKETLKSTLFDEKFSWYGATLSPLPEKFATDVVDATAKVAQGFAFAMNDEKFQSGPREGQWKSEAYTKEGITDLLVLMLGFYGIPAHLVKRMVDNAMKEDAKQRKL